MAKTICIVGDHPSIRIGGAEVQLAIIAHELAKNYEVIYFRISDYIVGTEIPPEFPNEFKLVEYDIKKSKGISRILGIFLMLKKINADLYIQYSSGKITGILGLYKMLFQKKFLFIATSDLDVEFTFSHGAWKNRGKLFKMSYKFGIKRVDSIVTKNQLMFESMQKKFPKKHVELIPSAFIEPKEECKSTFDYENYFLWVGSLRTVKYPQDIVELGLLSDVEILICGEGEELDRLLESAKDRKNIHFLGRQSRECILELMKKATALISTSPIEGFPNVFLEAWYAGIPVISRVDPDGIISKNKLGILYTEIDELVTITGNFEKYNNLVLSSNELQSFVMNNKSADKYILRYRKLVESLLPT